MEFRGDRVVNDRRVLIVGFIGLYDGVDTRLVG